MGICDRKASAGQAPETQFHQLHRIAVVNRGIPRSFMRILNIHDNASTVGGAEQIVIRISNELLKRGHNAAAAYMTGSLDEVQGVANFPCYLLDSTGRTNPSSQEAKLWMGKIIESEDPQVFLVHNIFDFGFLRWLATRGRVVRYVHDERVFCLDRSKLLPFAGAPICRVSMSRVCLLCVIGHAYLRRNLSRKPSNIWRHSRLLRERLRGLTLLAKVDHIITDGTYLRDVLVQNGLPGQKITPVALPPADDAKPTGKCPSSVPSDAILFAGRLVVQKGCDFVIRALALLENGVNLVICGRGPERDRLETLAAELGVRNRVYFFDWLPHDELRKFLAHAKAVVVPSTWPEPLGMVGIEALAHAKPVVAFDVGGVSEWLLNGYNGFLVPRGDTFALARAIHMIITDPSLAAKLGNAGRRLYEEKFSLDGFMSKLINIFDGVINDSR